jgi:hypothetical protein
MVRSDQRGRERIELMGNSRKEKAGLPEGSPDVSNTCYGLVPVSTAAATAATTTAASGTWLLWARFIDG